MMSILEWAAIDCPELFKDYKSPFGVKNPDWVGDKMWGDQREYIVRPENSLATFIGCMEHLGFDKDDPHFWITKKINRLVRVAHNLNRRDWPSTEEIQVEAYIVAQNICLERKITLGLAEFASEGKAQAKAVAALSLPRQRA